MQRLREDANQPSANPNIVQELTFGVEFARQGPNRRPGEQQAQCGHWSHLPKPGAKKRRQQPNPAQQVAQRCAGRTDRLALPVDKLDVPGFHRQRLSFAPAPHEIEAEKQKQESLLRTSVFQCVLGLCKQAKRIAAREQDAKK